VVDKGSSFGLSVADIDELLDDLAFAQRLARQPVASAMADVFISYAKADRPLAIELAAMLEAEGWKVWVDTSLIPGDDFRNEIMTELAVLGAVPSLSGQMHRLSLIGPFRDWASPGGSEEVDPCEAAHLTYKDLPPPFDVLHTENIGYEDKIRAAVRACRSGTRPAGSDVLLAQ